MEKLQEKIQEQRNCFISYRSNLFNKEIQIKQWKANELCFYDDLIKKLNKMANETEIKLSTMNALGSDLKRKFANSYVQSEEDKRKKGEKYKMKLKKHSP